MIYAPKSAIEGRGVRGIRRIHAPGSRVTGMDVTPGTALFVGGFVAGLFWFAALLAFLAAGGSLPVVRALAAALAGLGAVFLAGGVVVALLVRIADRSG
jgi:hypothetical protein